MAEAAPAGQNARGRLPVRKSGVGAQHLDEPSKPSEPTPVGPGAPVPGEVRGPLPPEPTQLIEVPEDEPPSLCVVVDTEEEFDWAAPFDRANTAVTAMDDVERGQAVCEAFGIRPHYTVDYAVACQDQGAAPLRQFLAEGRAEVGAHLHPWVTPPFDEQVCARNSYPGNLDPELEAAKLATLTEAIETHLGQRPTAYKAGRYGLGPNSAGILEAQGYQVDLSTRPAFDLSRELGPDYSHHPARPYWFGKERPLLALPSTGGFVGYLADHGPRLWNLARDPRLQWTRLGGLLSKLRACKRLHLSPEGADFEDLRTLVESLLARGVRTFNFSYHSPTLKPGCTDYVQSESDLSAFLETFRRFFDYFLGELGGTATTPLELHARWLARTPPELPQPPNPTPRP